MLTVGLVLFSLLVSTTFADFTAIPSSDMEYLIERINHFRAGFQWETFTFDAVELDTEVDLDGTNCAEPENSYWAAEHWSVDGTTYDDFQGFVDTWLNPSRLSCSDLTLTADCSDPDSCNAEDLFKYILNPGVVSLSCWEDHTDGEVCNDEYVVLCIFLGVFKNLLELGAVTECPSCGDGITFLDAAADDTLFWEDCDAEDIEFCDADTCEAEIGYACTYDENWETEGCSSVCGDGRIVGDEGCDSGNVATDGCDDCSVVLGYECSNDGVDPTMDDPETTECLVLEGWDCDADNSCAVVIGDSYAVSDWEECDDGNSVNSDGCDGEGDVTAGWGCKVWYDEEQKSECEAVRGDGEILGDEECDDGNTDNNDGCDSDGMLESEDEDWECTGKPSLCGPVDWENPIDDSVINSWITTQFLTSLKTWAESTSGPSRVKTAVFERRTASTSSTNFITASLTLEDTVGVTIANARDSIEQIRAEIASMVDEECRGSLEENDLSEDDCDYVDALTQAVLSEIYPQTTKRSVAAVEQVETDVVVGFRVVSRYPSSSSALACGLSFVVALLFAFFH